MKTQIQVERETGKGAGFYRLILWEIDEETGAKSCMEIMECEGRLGCRWSARDVASRYPDAALIGIDRKPIDLGRRSLLKALRDEMDVTNKGLDR
jgi:hypothetical protein